MALVLTRQRGETIIIGDDIYVTVESLDHGKARLSIAAPSEVCVDRLEVREKRNAGGLPADFVDHDHDGMS